VYHRLRTRHQVSQIARWYRRAHFPLEGRWRLVLAHPRGRCQRPWWPGRRLAVPCQGDQL